MQPQDKKFISSAPIVSSLIPIFRVYEEIAVLSVFGHGNSRTILIETLKNNSRSVVEYNVEYPRGALYSMAGKWKCINLKDTTEVSSKVKTLREASHTLLDCNVLKKKLPDFIAIMDKACEKPILLDDSDSYIKNALKTINRTIKFADDIYAYSQLFSLYVYAMSNTTNIAQKWGKELGGAAMFLAFYETAKICGASAPVSIAAIGTGGFLLGFFAKKLIGDKKSWALKIICRIFRSS